MKRLTETQKQIVKQGIEAGSRTKTIVRNAKISHPTFYRLRRDMQSSPVVYSPTPVTVGEEVLKAIRYVMQSGLSEPMKLKLISDWV